MDCHRIHVRWYSFICCCSCGIDTGCGHDAKIPNALTNVEEIFGNNMITYTSKYMFFWKQWFILQIFVCGDATDALLFGQQ